MLVYPGPSSLPRSKPSPIKSILKNPSITVSSLPGMHIAFYFDIVDPPPLGLLGPSDPVSVPPTTDISSTRFDAPLPTRFPFANRPAPASGALIRRRPAVGVLDVSTTPSPCLSLTPVPFQKPISVCTRFATWLENQKCVHDETLLRAVERDGNHLLCLAKATVTFDNALRGQVVPPTVNGVASPLIEHARTLRIFAELLKLKISEGSLNEELETAVLRDGEALLRLAISCLEFDQAIHGSDSAQVK